MLDFRLLTFMKLCELKSYTKTAENLHMTQPTVTQHVQYLERQYGVPLVEYHGKKRYANGQKGSNCITLL